MSDVAEAAVALTAELVAIDSVNPGLVPGAAGEARDRRAPAGPAATRRASPRTSWRPSGTGPTGPASWPSDRDRAADPTVVLNGHLDTVGVAGMPEPFTPVRDGDRLSGRGAGDMKGGVAAMVVAAEELVASRAPVPRRPGARRRRGGRQPGQRGGDRRAARPWASARTSAVIGEPTELALAQTLRGFALVERAIRRAARRTPRSPSSASTP